MSRILLPLCLIILVSAGSAMPQEQNMICGVATGFPPYQFTLDGKAAGFDVDVAAAVCARLGVRARFEQGNWDNVLNMLRFGRIDMVAGMEINTFRSAYFEFSNPYATRHDVIFVSANSTATTVEDLFGQVITGDRHSYVELLWKDQGIYRNFRIMQTKTKEESMDLLAMGQTMAAIMPLQVGKYLARERGIKVRVLANPDPGSDVAIALRMGQPELLEKINQALWDMNEEGELTALKAKWFEEPAE
jgi:ABC-type amino acid transport substrate-binding protein